MGTELLCLEKSFVSSVVDCSTLLCHAMPRDVIVLCCALLGMSCHIQYNLQSFGLAGARGQSPWGNGTFSRQLCFACTDKRLRRLWAHAKPLAATSCAASRPA